jgi:tetratricopeptide (TPR) repeat protein
MLRLEPLRCLTALLAAGCIGVVASSSCECRSQTPSLPSSQSPSLPSPEAASPSPPPQVSPVELGDTLVYHKRYQAAIVAYTSAPEKTAAVWNKMGIAYQMMLNLTDATRCYKQSIKLDPRDPSVLNNLGTAEESLGDYRQAERMYRKAIQLDPNFALAYKNLATSLMTQRKYKQGRAADERALALDPTIFTQAGSLTVDNPASVRDRGAMNYYMAIDCARARQTACALEHLRMALNQGYIDPNKLASDANFAALASDPGFQQLLSEQRGK